MTVTKMNKEQQERFEWALDCMKDESFVSLTKRGRGSYLEQLCIDFGLSEYGTSKAKAERLLKFYTAYKSK